MADVQIPLLSTPTQAAKIIGISPRKLRDLIAARRITVKMLDGRIRLTRDAILSFVEDIPEGYQVGERPPASRASTKPGRRKHPQKSGAAARAGTHNWG